MRYSKEHIYNKVYKIFQGAGLDSEGAKAITENLVLSEMAGNESHGLRMVGAHVNKILKGQYNIKPEINIIRKTSAFALIDGDNGLGMVTGERAMELAMEGCKESGLFMVLCRNSNTYGSAFIYSNMALRENLIGITFSNSPAQMAPLNGKDKLLGTNPLAISIPALSEKPFVFDMATSIVAKSKINRAKDEGREIPLGWALDEAGNPTTNPMEAVKGLILPMAGAKGYGLSMAIDILAGLLSGAAYLNQVGRFYSDSKEGMNVGQVFIAINPAVIFGEDFLKEMDEYIRTVKNSSLAGETPIYIPGEGKQQRILNSQDKGIEIGDKLYEELCELERGMR